MLPLHPSFRRLVLERIPQLDREDLNDYDNLMALRLELVHKRSLVPAREQTDQSGGGDQGGPHEPEGAAPHKGPAKPTRGKPSPVRPYGELPSQGQPQQHQQTPRDEIDRLIDETTRQANNIIAPFRAEFDALHRLWLARRSFALHQGGLLQIPSTPDGFAGFFKTLANYFRTQLGVFPILAKNRLRNISFRGTLALIVFVVLVIFALISLEEDKRPGDNPRPQPPDSTVAR